MWFLLPNTTVKSLRRKTNITNMALHREPLGRAVPVSFELAAGTGQAAGALDYQATHGFAGLQKPELAIARLQVFLP